MISQCFHLGLYVYVCNLLDLVMIDSLVVDEAVDDWISCSDRDRPENIIGSCRQNLGNDNAVVLLELPRSMPPFSSSR